MLKSFLPYEISNYHHHYFQEVDGKSMKVIPCFLSHNIEKEEACNFQLTDDLKSVAFSHYLNSSCIAINHLQFIDYSIKDDTISVLKGVYSKDKVIYLKDINTVVSTNLVNKSGSVNTKIRIVSSTKDNNAEQTLYYPHCFSKYVCKISDYSKITVILTGENQYGFKEYQKEVPPQYLDIISFNKGSKEFRHMSSTNISKTFHKEYFYEFYFNKCGSKILLVTNSNSFILFSLLNEEFGAIHRWHTRVHFLDYFYHTQYGDVVIVVSGQNEVFLVVESKPMDFKKIIQLNLNVPPAPSLKQSWFQVCVTGLGQPLLMMYNYDTMHIFVYDLMIQKLIVALATQKILKPNNILSDKFGELFFIFAKFQGYDGMTMKIFYAKDENLELKNLARKAVLCFYTSACLKSMDLPKSVLRYLNL